MRIVVIGSGIALDDQTRAYTEDKVFSALAPYSRHIGHVEVTVAANSTDRNDAETACTVMVALAPSGRERVRARASQAYSAIDSAATRIELVMKSRHAQRLSS